MDNTVDYMLQKGDFQFKTTGSQQYQTIRELKLKRKRAVIDSLQVEKGFNSKVSELKQEQKVNHDSYLKVEDFVCEVKQEILINQNSNLPQQQQNQINQSNYRVEDYNQRLEFGTSAQNDFWEVSSSEDFLWNGGKIQQKRLKTRQKAQESISHSIYRSTQAIIQLTTNKNHKTKALNHQKMITNQSERYSQSIGQSRDKSKSQRSIRKKRRVNVDNRLLHTISDLFEQRNTNSLITLQSIANRLDLSYSTVCKLYREWSQDNTMFQRKMLLKRPKDKKQEATQIRMTALERLLYMNPYLTQTEMVEELNRFPEIKASKGLITRFIIYDLLKFADFAKKKTKRISEKRNQAQSKKMRESYCRRYRQLTSNPRNSIFFLGQLEMNIYGMRNQGWCKKNQQLVLRCPLAKSKTVSAPFIVYKNGSFMSQTKVGLLQKNDLYAIVRRFLDEVEQTYPYFKNYVIVDPVNIQTRFKIDQFKKQFRVQEVLFIPPFSPQLSIIEYFFHQLKEKLRVKKIDCEMRLKQQFQKLIKEDQSKIFASFFERTRHYVELGIQCKDF